MQEAQEASREAEAGHERLTAAAMRIEKVVGQLSSSSSELSGRVGSASSSAVRTLARLCHGEASAPCTMRSVR